VRRQFPGVRFATWTLALAGQGAAAGLREVETQDAPRFVAALRPALHVYQSHYPDWLPPGQKPDYVRGYAPYIDAVRGSSPGVPLGVQADVASTQPFRRDPDWMRTLEASVRALGVAVTTYYEFSLRWEVYFAPPALRSATLGPDGSALLIFDQRLDPASCTRLAGRGGGQAGPIQDVSVDGNLLRFRTKGPLPTGASTTIPIDGIATDPAVRFPLAGKGQGTANALPAGSTVTVGVAGSAP